MNPWELLGIEPTREEREIKRAYTRQLRQHPPETDPDGFQSLRAAYETALFFARHDPETLDAAEDEPPSPSGNPTASGEDTEPAPPSGDPATERSKSTAAPDPYADTAPSGPIESGGPEIPPPNAAFRPLRADAPPEWLPEAQALLRRIRDDFPDHSKRQFRPYWESVLDIPLLWNLDAKGWLGWNLFEFLGEAAHDRAALNSDVHIGKEAWIFLEGTFGWLEDEHQLYAAFPEEIAHSVLDPIRAAKGLQQSGDLGVPNPRAADLANLRDPSSYPKGLGYIISIAVLILVNLFRNCGEDTPRQRQIHQSYSPSTLTVSPNSSPLPPEVYLKNHPPYIEDIPPPNPHP